MSLTLCSGCRDSKKKEEKQRFEGKHCHSPKLTTVQQNIFEYDHFDLELRVILIKKITLITLTEICISKRSNVGSFKL